METYENEFALAMEKAFNQMLDWQELQEILKAEAQAEANKSNRVGEDEEEYYDTNDYNKPPF